jgi:hypothetical protein
MRPQLALAAIRRRYREWVLAAGICCAVASYATSAGAAPKQGDILQTDAVSMLLVNRDFTTHTTSSLKDTINLSGVVGLHYYFVDRVRIGMGLQFTERLWPKPPAGVSRFQRFALMPQLGWSFYDPFYTALIFSYAPRTLGRSNLDMAVIGALGAALPITRRMKVSLAVEAPFAFHYHRTLGLVALMGVSFLF